MAPDPMDEPAAELGWRLGARVVDVVTFGWLVAFVLVEIDQRLLGGDPWGRRAVGIEFDSARPVVLVLLLVLVYEVAPTAVFGATAGKAFFGLRIRRRPDDPVPTPLATVARAAALYAPPVLFGGLGALATVVLLVSVVVPRNGRGLHDRLAGTTVVTVADR